MGIGRGAALFTALALALSSEPVHADTPGPGEAVVLRSAGTGGVEASVAALILSGQEAGDLEVSLLPIPLPGPAGRSRVALVVDLEGPSLLEGHEEGPLLTELYAYALDGEGDVAGFLTEGFLLDPAAHHEVLLAGGVKFLSHLQLPPGTYSLRLLVLRRQTGRFNLQTRTLEVPAWGDTDPVLLPPFFSERSEGRILVEQAGPLGGDPDLSFPVLPLGDSRVPLAGAPSPGADSAILHLAGWRLAQPPVAEVRTAEGALMKSLQWRPRAVAASPGSGLDLFEAELPTGDLAPGSYVVRVGSTSTPFSVTRSPVASTGSADRAAAGRREFPPGTLATAYLDSLRLLARADRSTVGGALFELLQSAVSDGGGISPERLSGTLLAVASYLGASDAESLVPLIELHDGLYRAYHRQGDYLLATLSRQLVAHLLEAYARSSSSKDARRIVASALVSRGDYLLRVGSNPAAQGAFEEALTHDPAHEAALLGLATIREAYGDYERAASLLQRLVPAWPGNDEAKLRLAINLRRLGSANRAESLFRRMLEPQVEEWVGVLAHQELADFLVEDDRLLEATELLSAAVDRWPYVERFYIQQMLVLDLQHRPLAARKLLEDLTLQRKRDVDSPRLRYTSWPRATFERDRHFLERSAANRLEVLAEGLAFAPSGGR
ncbi:MAG: hypothetical protein O7J95_10070 [Planctomycetota bacterium]|nr:hypothetical protein [Planctomycetota bacterium]